MKLVPSNQLSVVRLITVFILCTFYFLLCTSVYAQTSTSSAKVNPKFTSIRKVVDNYEIHLDQIVDRADALLDNLQSKIITAKAGGIDTTESDNLMKVARANMVKVKQKINDIEKLKVAATKKTDWEIIKKDIKTIKTDLKVVSANALKIIKLLT